MSYSSLRGLAIASLAVLSACEVHVGNCRENDGGECADLFPSTFDATVVNPDASRAQPPDAAASDASAQRLDAAVLDGGMDAATTGTDAGGPPVTTVAAFCDAINSRGLAWATKLDECCPMPADRSSATATSILNLIGAYSDQAADGCISFYGGLVDAKTVTFNSAAAASCISGFLEAYPQPPAMCPAAGFDLEQMRSTIGHGAPQLAQIAACRDTLRGSIALGQACTKNFECSPGLTCMPITTASGAGSTCKAPSTANESCDNSGNCAAGLTCVGTTAFGRVCRAPSELADFGGNCQASQECVVGDVCSSSTSKCTMPTLGTVICK